ncbi:hypothetical protein AVL61_15880 [Kocuria rosea subsp. polaris]|uniref:Uncharacterized protein n=1 Tax=Kocuria rosea subsp. polaris TaxID=136273 RepID=A0A0W8I2B5_KOCRO|nr:hypothetical protein [Kocuria polaris]KUG51719.1 hypothetical protein AVL61_15880 [Kocuria polaris]
MAQEDTTPHGITVLDIHGGRWALWQVSVTTMTGPLRAMNTNAVVADGFDEKAFLSLTYHRPVLLTARARQVCDVPVVLEAAQFDPEEFIALCDSWVDLLQGMFWAENDRRAALNAENAQHRKDAKAAGRPAPEYQRLAPLKDIDWPGVPPASSWSTDTESQEPVTVEALRVANGCARLLNFWLEIEADRTRKARTYLKGIGGPQVRHWPQPTPSAAAESAETDPVLVPA